MLATSHNRLTGGSTYTLAGLEVNLYIDLVSLIFIESGAGKARGVDRVDGRNNLQSHAC